MQSLHLADDELSCIDLGFTEVTGEGEEVEVLGCESVLSELAEWAALVGDGLSGCVVDLTTPAPPIPSIEATLIPPLSTPVPPPPAAPPPSSPPPPPTDPLSIHHRLKDFYSQRITKPLPFPPQHIRPTSILLQRLLQENSFNMVVIRLHPLDKGYSVSLRTISGKEFQESVQPYPQNLLLEYINNEELPPMFVDFWETTFPQIFYTGCVLVEVKDGRICNPPIISHVLLKPTTQTLIGDVTTLLLGDTTNSCSSDLRLALEGSVVNNVQPPLSLNPSIDEGRRRCNRYYLKKAMLTRKLSSKTSFQIETRNHQEIKIQGIRGKRKQHLFEFTSRRKLNTFTSKLISCPPSPDKVNTNTLHNPAISALANSFRNSVHQCQQQAAVAAAATPNASVPPSRDVSGLVGSVGSVEENANLNLPGLPSSGMEMPGIGACTTTTHHSPQSSGANATVISLLNDTGMGTQTTTFHQQQIGQQVVAFQQNQLQQGQIDGQQHKFVAKKMPVSNLIGSRLRPVNSNNCSAIRIPLSTITSHLTPHHTELQVRPDLQPFQQTIRYRK